jgi:ketosteroid isomerase-like protein
MRDVRRLLDRGYEIIWREDDPERALRGLEPDFEWVVPRHPEGAVHRGPEATIRFFREWIESWEELQVDWQLHPAGPERVLAVLTMRGRGRESGVPVEMVAGQLWTFRDGVAVRMELYEDVEEGFRAAGLAP